MAKNPYTVLGVSELATDEEIRNAYRRLAKQYHPDLNPNDPSAAQKMNDVNVAYDQIKTAEKRAAYRAEQQNSYSRPNNQDPFSYYYRPGSSQQSYYNQNTYHQSGNGYYGGSYTGRPQNDEDEPPFGWDSVFGNQESQRQFVSLQYRLYRILRFLFIGFMLMSIGRCICAPIFYAEAPEPEQPMYHVASSIPESEELKLE